VGWGVSASYDTDSQLALEHKLDGDLGKAWKTLKLIYTRPPICEVKVSHPYQEELNQINLAAFSRFSSQKVKVGMNVIPRVFLPSVASRRDG